MNIQLPDIKPPPEINPTKIIAMDSTKELASSQFAMLDEAKRKFEQLELKKNSPVGPLLKPTVPRLP